MKKAGRGRRNSATLFVLAGVAVGMVGLSFAAVPLYRLFCQVTGFGGTTQVAEETPTRVDNRVVTVRFNADTAAGMPWRFRPEQREVRVHLGEVALAYFTAENLSDHTIVGNATFNVTPYKAGPYFSKIACFCFDEQTLVPGQIAEMPVTFFVDPEMADDPKLKEVTTITLSYTFFEARDSAPAQTSGDVQKSTTDSKGT